MNNITFLEDPVEGPCEYCGNVDELRPYGKNGAMICYDCGVKPENYEATIKAIDEALNVKAN